MSINLLSVRLHLDTAAFHADRNARPDLVSAINSLIHQIDNPPAPPLPSVVPLKRPLRRSIAPAIPRGIDVAEPVLG